MWRGEIAMVNWVDHIEGTTEGTPVNRKNLMDMQGFAKNGVTIKNSNGVTTITEVNGNDETTVTTISKSNEVTNIVTRFTGANGITIALTTNISKSNGVTTINSEVSE